MAILQSAKAAPTAQPRAGIGICSATAEYNLTAALALNDVINMVKIPAGATVLDMILVSDNLDTNGAPTITLDVGDNTVANYYINASLIGQTNGIERMAAHPKTYTAEDMLSVTVATGPATGAVAGNISFTVFYTMDK